MVELSNVFRFVVGNREGSSLADIRAYVNFVTKATGQPLISPVASDELWLISTGPHSQGLRDANGGSLSGADLCVEERFRAVWSGLELFLLHVENASELFLVFHIGVVPGLCWCVLDGPRMESELLMPESRS